MAAPARLFWPTGGLWSAMTWRACRRAGLALSPISGREVAAGGLAGAGLVVVPGGWPARKRAALGRAGCGALREFVLAGGRYLGICGGAGLALSVEDGLGLVDLGRRTGGQRLPAISGPFRARATARGLDHPLWRGLAPEEEFHVWWPAQFAATAPSPARVLARYAAPAPGLCTSDLRADQVPPGGWAGLERAYGLRLDPSALTGRAAAVSAACGRGEALLTYLHLDTPGDPAGEKALANLWRAWLGLEPSPPGAGEPEPPAAAARLAERARGLWELGRELGLWQERHRWMPLWRRGARGLEFWSLAALAGLLAREAGRRPGWAPPPELEPALEPVWRQGPGVLAAQAAALAGGPPAAQASPSHARWFPAPRRTGGELARACRLLEEAAFAAAGD